MKRLILIMLLMIVFINSWGQWYRRKYNQEHIYLLTEEQLEKERIHAEDIVLAGGVAALVGGVAILAGNSYLKRGLPEDPSAFEDFIGAKNLGKSLYLIGTVSFAGGAIFGMTGVIRLSSIRSVRNNYYSGPSVYLSPVLIIGNYKGTSSPGLNLRINF